MQKLKFLGEIFGRKTNFLENFQGEIQVFPGEKLAVLTGTRSKIFNEIVLKDNHFLTLHEKCI